MSIAPGYSGGTATDLNRVPLDEATLLNLWRLASNTRRRKDEMFWCHESRNFMRSCDFANLMLRLIAESELPEHPVR